MSEREVRAVRKIAWTLAAATAVLAGVATTNAEAVTRTPHRCTHAGAPRLCAIHFHVKRTNTTRRRMDRPPIRYRWVAERHPARRARVLTYWVHAQRHAAARLVTWRKAQARARARAHISHGASPWSAAWYADALCVHSHEGAWNSNTGNGYYGGMQFDSASWLANGGGQFASRADLASPHDQLLVAYHYWQGSGWGPWPTTAAMCGLL